MMAGSTVATTFGLVADRRGDALAQRVDLRRRRASTAVVTSTVRIRSSAAASSA